MGYTDNWTQEQKDKFVQKQREKQLALIAPVGDQQKLAEYSKTLNFKPKEYSLKEEKKIFLDELISRTKKNSDIVLNTILEEKDYQDCCNLLIDYCFGFENEKLKDRGGIYIWAQPGAGKSCLVLTAGTLLNNLRTLKGNGWKRHVWYNMVEDISKHIRGEKPDLTYSFDVSIILDDFTEKINQVNSFDYKFSLNEVIQNRYEKWRSKDFKTLITSNIHPDDFSNFMDSRSITRFKEQYLLIELLGKNKRV